MFLRNLRRVILRVAFNLFYTRFAFTYDLVSAIVSFGHWRDWTRAAIPRIRGRRVLEIPCGTGNLLLDMEDAGYAPIGVDLSSEMLRISHSKLRTKARVSHDDLPHPSHPALPRGILIRATAQALPFSTATFDSIVMTFPPGFVYDPRALAEFHRVLDPNGRLIWVDGGRLLPRGFWARAIQSGVDLIEGRIAFTEVSTRRLAEAGFQSREETVRDEASVVSVVLATKRNLA